MSTALFWLLMLYFLVSTVVAVRAAVRGPKKLGLLSVVIGVFLVAFPWVRSWLSTEGRGDFHPAGAVANLEWLLVLFGLGPVHLVCLYAIVTAKRVAT